MSEFGERPIHRIRKPVYEISLSVYPVAVCGEDLQKGKPAKLSLKGEDLYVLKCRIDELLLSSAKCDGKCFIEMIVTEDEKYFDCDEWWCVVDHLTHTVKKGGRYGC